MSPCPSATHLERLLAEQLSDPECLAVVQHVEDCADCREVLAQLTEEAGDDPWPPGPMAESPPAFLTALSRSPPPEPCTPGLALDTAAFPRAGLHSSVRPRIPGYEVLEELGRGGTGVVYKARHQALQRLVALKVLLVGEHAAPAQLARFRAEAEALARLQHPNIVQVYEVGEHGNLPFFALELVDGPTLAGRLGGAPRPAQEAAQMVEELARAVHAAHQQGVVHRDLKPPNILLTADGTPKISDFGLAKRVDVAGMPTQSGLIVGTPSYMAPEQARGDHPRVGMASDVYGLGAILYELLTGRPPFRAVTPLDTLLQVLYEEPVPPRRLEPNLPRDLETVCLKCLHKEPSQRYSSAEALADDLRRFLASEPITARPSNLLERGVKWSRRRPAVAALILVTTVAVLAIGGVIAGLFYNTRLQEAKDQAEAAVEQARKFEYFYRIASAHVDWRDGNLAQVASQLNGCPDDRRGWEWHYLQRLCGLDLLTLTGHKNAVSAVAISPDGTRIASASHDHTVKVWDLDERRARLRERPKGEEKAPSLELRGHANQVLCVAFSPDGTRLASGDANQTIKLWDLKTGRESCELKGHPDRVFSVKFSPDGTRLASSGRGTVKVWDLNTRGVLDELKGFQMYAGLVLSVAFSPDGKLLATPHPDKSVKLWQWEPGPGDSKYKLMRELKGHPDTVQEVTFSPDGTRLASASWDGTVKVWDLAPSPYPLPRRGEEGLLFHPLPRRGGEGRVRGPAGEGATPVRTLRGHTGTVSGVAFSPNGTRLASGSTDGTVRVWDLLAEDAADSVLLTLKGHTSGVRSVGFTPDGTRIISGSSDGTIKLWDSASPQESHTWKGHARSIASVAFSADESRLVSASQDGFIKIWDTATGQVILSWRGHQRDPLKEGEQDDVLCVVFSLDGKRLASSGSDGMIKVWDPATRREICRFSGHVKPVSALAFSPDGQRLASGSDDYTVKIWDVETRQRLRSLEGHSDWVRGVAFNRDGTRLATASFDEIGLIIWDTSTGQKLHELRGHEGPVWSVAFSPDGTKLASASRDKKVRIWDVTPGRRGEPQLLFKLEGHKDQVSGLAFSPDGSRLASGSADHTVRIWDMTTGQEALCLKGHTNWPRSVAFSPSGTKLASGSLDLTIRIWDAARLTPESAVEREATGLLTGLFGNPLCRADVSEFLERASTIRPEVRQRALALAERYREEADPKRYHQAARDTVRRPYLSGVPYGLALRQAEAASRLAPIQGEYTITLGMAQYRAGRYAQARATLQAHEDVPAALAFLAMTQHQLGEARQAQETLVRLRASMKQPGRAEDAEAQAFLRETEALLHGAVERKK